MKNLHLFEGFGVELEYMIVDAKTLKVLPVADEVLKAFEGKEYVSDIDNGPVSWSNELAMHVIEIKTNGPSSDLGTLSAAFAENVNFINKILETSGAMLLPSAMHPFMDPYSEMKIWPHETNEVYEKYHQIFNCKGHGWANLQSVHLNLPFANDEEFGRLHAAIRLVLPILPALAASSPIKDSTITGTKDTRLKVYQLNQQQIPSIAGKVIPEAVFTIQDYHDKILKKLYNDIAPYDADGILQYEWLNSRGATVRFERNTIEIRVLDIQECPLSDMAILQLITEVLKSLVYEKWSTVEEQKNWHEDDLYAIFSNCVENAENALIENKNYLKVFGIGAESITAGELWNHLFNKSNLTEPSITEALNNIFTNGTLSSRILKYLGNEIDDKKVKEVYSTLAACLKKNKPWII